jgi:hypothetical protein
MDRERGEHAGREGGDGPRVLRSALRPALAVAERLWVVQAGRRLVEAVVELTHRARGPGVDVLLGQPQQGRWIVMGQQRAPGGVKLPVDATVGAGVIDHLGQLDRGDTLGHLVAKRISRPALDRMPTQVRGQGAQPRPRGSGCGAVAGNAAQA